jgi:hypothetical protein
MKWPPSEFWKATPYDCLLAAGGMAKINEKRDPKKLSKSEIKELVALNERERAKNGKG